MINEMHSCDGISHLDNQVELCSVAQRLKLALRCQNFEVPHSIQQNRIRNPGVSFAARCQHYDLPVLQASRLGEPEHSQIREMFAQQSGTFRQSQLRNHEKQHTTGLEPAITVFQKDQFQSLVVALSGFPIVGRVQIKQGHCFCRAPDIHGVSLQSLDSQRSRLVGPIGVDLDSIAMSGYAKKQVSERHAISHARIKS